MVKTLCKLAVVGGFVAMTSSVSHGQTKPAGAGDWPTYGGDPGSTRHSSLTEITPANVAKLAPAWTYHAFVRSGSSGGSRRTAGRPRRWWRWRRPRRRPGHARLASHPDCRRRHHVHADAVQPRDCARSAHRQGTLGLQESRRRHESRCGVLARRRHRAADAPVCVRRAARRPRCAHRRAGPDVWQQRHGGFPPGDHQRLRRRADQPVVAAEGLQEPRHHRRARAGIAGARLCRRHARLGLADRQTGLAVPPRAAAGRGRSRHLGRGRLEEPLRREHLGIHQRRSRARTRLPADRIAEL